MTDLFDPGAPPVVEALDGGTIDCDILIIGSGMGGGTLAHATRDSGARVLGVERGDFLPREDANWSPVEVFQRRRYKNAEKWYDAATGSPLQPGHGRIVGAHVRAAQRTGLDLPGGGVWRCGDRQLAVAKLPAEAGAQQGRVPARLRRGHSPHSGALRPPRRRAVPAGPDHHPPPEGPEHRRGADVT